MGTGSSIFSQTLDNPILISLSSNLGIFNQQQAVQNIEVSLNDDDNMTISWNASTPVTNDPTTGPINKYRIYFIFKLLYI